MEEDAGRVEQTYATPVSTETEPLLTHPTKHFNFRLGRETQHTTKCTELAHVFKFCFCSLGFWGHRAWTYIPRVLLATLCIYRAFDVLYFEVRSNCPSINAPNISNSTKTQTGSESWAKQNISKTSIYLSFLWLLSSRALFLLVVS